MDLPDIKGKVVVAVDGILNAIAQLGALDVAIKRLDTGGTEKSLQQAGQAFIKFGDNGELAAVRIRSSTAQSRGDLDQLEQRARVFAGNLEGDFKKGTDAVIRLGKDGGAALTSVSENASQTSGVFARLGPLITQIGGVAMPVLIGAAVTLGLVFAPLIIELAAFTVGLTAALAVMTLGLGLFAGLAIGAVVLANRSGQLAGPLKALSDHASAAADALGKQAAPAAAQVLHFVDLLIGPVAELARQTLAWLESNNRLGNALGVASGFANIFFAAAQRLGPVIGSFLDAWLSRGPQWEGLFRSAMNIGVDAIRGLLANLLRLSDWFNSQLPVMGPVLKATFDGIGTAMQGVAQILGALLIPLFRLMAQHSDLVKGAMIGLVVILGAAVIIVVGLGLAVIATAAALQWLFDRANQVASAFSAIVRGAYHAAFDRIKQSLDGAAGAARGVGTAIDAIGSAASRAIGAVQNLVGALARVPGAAQSALASIPGVSAATGALHAAGVPGFQSGGFVLPGSLFRVGEAGPELGYALPGGGAVISPGGGSSASSGGGSIDLDRSQLLAQAVSLLAQIAGQPKLNALMAQGRVG